MTYLLLQTFLLLLASYFLGAFTACLMKRAARREPAVLAAGVQPAPQPVARVAAPVAKPAVVPAPAAQIAPRNYEPLQPKIDILARPEPKAAPVQADTSRFDRALANAVLKDDTPRKCIVEIRPAILKPVTARPGPNSVAAMTASKTAPVAQPAKPAILAQPVAAKTASAPVPQTAPQTAATASTSSAALAAVAAAKAAAAAVPKATTTASGVPVVTPPPKPVPQAPPQSAVPVTAAPAPITLAKPAELPQPQMPAAAVPAVAKPAAFDDFLRIRAIDEALS